MLRRHDLVRVHPQAALRIEGHDADAALSLAAHAWIARGRPLVAARQDAAVPADTVRLGLALPAAPDGRSDVRRRLACLVATADISAVEPPLSIRACRTRLAPALAESLGELADQLDSLKIPHGVYGSLSWELLSGETYRHAGSDIDLICDVADPGQLQAALSALDAAATRLPCRLDGELRLPDQSAIAWRELATAWAARAEGRARTHVLVKGRAAPVLMPLERVLAHFGGAHIDG